MDKLTQMEAFIAVVDQGGYTDAARRLGVSKSAVSKHVSALEARMGARLLNRTTRHVTLTDIGRAYYREAAAVLENANRAEAMVTSMQASPRGSLRISAPISFSLHHGAAAITKFLVAYPDIDVDMELNDGFVDLLAEGFDLAIRIGRLEDSTLIARKLADTQTHFLASEAYLQKHGRPQSVADLKDHSLLVYTQRKAPHAWTLSDEKGQRHSFRASGRMDANNGEALLKAVEAGLGIAELPSFMTSDALRAGRVVQILPGVTRGPVGIYVVYPDGPFLQPKLRHFVDFMVAEFKGQAGQSW